MYLSIVIPIYNEERNIRKLYDEIKAVLGRLDLDYEVIAVDDGSRDKSYQVLEEIAKKNKKLKIIKFRRNFGQTAAISAGIDASSGKIIIPMDADLQNNPVDISLLLDKLEQGFDVVSGWRKNRQDKLISRKIPSWIANSLISFITGLKLHDYGCTMKVYKAEAIKGVRFYGEMHRFMPAYVFWYGARVGEVVVGHRARIYGKTKYSITKTFRVLLDLLTVKFLTKYSTRPMHFFGYIGYWMIFFSFLSGCLAVFLRFFYNLSFISTPLPLLTVFLMLVALQFILMGLLAEILIRVYYESPNKSTYAVKEKINLE